MPRQKKAVHEALVNRNVVIVASAVVIVGAVVTYGAIKLGDTDWCSKTLSELLKEVGTAAFGIGILALMWEVAARRAFMSEILATVDLADDVEDNGLLSITFEYLQGVPWPDLFRESDSFDLFVSYARTWTKANEMHIQGMVDRGSRVRVLLPDPDDLRIVTELATWFRTTPDDVKSRISGAIKHYLALAGRANAKVDVKLAASCPLFTAYLFPRVVVFTTHSHRPAPAPVPTFIAVSGKPLYTFFRNEFEHLWAAARSPQNTGEAQEVPNDNRNDKPS
jgi:hypothetical protein